MTGSRSFLIFLCILMEIVLYGKPTYSFSPTTYVLIHPYVRNATHTLMQLMYVNLDYFG